MRLMLLPPSIHHHRGLQLIQHRVEITGNCNRGLDTDLWLYCCQDVYSTVLAIKARLSALYQVQIRSIICLILWTGGFCYDYQLLTTTCTTRYEVLVLEYILKHERWFLGIIDFCRLSLRYVLYTYTCMWSALVISDLVCASWRNVARRKLSLCTQFLQSQHDVSRHHGQNGNNVPAGQSNTEVPWGSTHPKTRNARRVSS